MEDFHIIKGFVSEDITAKDVLQFIIMKYDENASLYNSGLGYYIGFNHNDERIKLYVDEARAGFDERIINKDTKYVMLDVEETDIAHDVFHEIIKFFAGYLVRDDKKYDANYTNVKVGTFDKKSTQYIALIDIGFDAKTIDKILKNEGKILHILTM